MKHFGLKIGESAAGQYDAVLFPKCISTLPLPQYFLLGIPNPFSSRKDLRAQTYVTHSTVWRFCSCISEMTLTNDSKYWEDGYLILLFFFSSSIKQHKKLYYLFYVVRICIVFFWCCLYCSR